MSRLLPLLALLAAAAPAARAEEAPPAPPAREAAPVPPAKEGGSPAPSRLSVWRAGVRPPADVPPGTIVRAAERRGEKGAAADRRKGAPRAAPPRDAVEILWHAPGS